MKKVIAAAFAALMLVSCGNSAETAVTNADYIYGKIESVSGNDIVLLMADYNENAESAENDDSAEGSEDKGSDGSERERPDGFKKPGNGEMPEGFDPENMPEDFDPSKFGGERPERPGKSGSKGEKSESGDSGGESSSDSAADDSGDSGSKSKRERPEGFDPENMPEGFTKPENGERPERSDSEGGERKKPSEKSGGGKSGGSSKYTLTGEQEELRIPVGTTVTTSAGVKTDFDALSAGDMIKCSVEKDADGQEVVTEVWILEN